MLTDVIKELNWIGRLVFKYAKNGNITGNERKSLFGHIFYCEYTYLVRSVREVFIRMDVHILNFLMVKTFYFYKDS